MDRQAWRLQFVAHLALCACAVRGMNPQTGGQLSFVREAKQNKHRIWGSHACSGRTTSHVQETQYELEQGSARFLSKALDSPCFSL